MLGTRETVSLGGTCAAKSNAPLSQDPVTILFSVQRPPEEFGNYGLPYLQPRVKD